MQARKWQYKVESVKQSVWSYKSKEIDGLFNDKLNRLGMEGWELVTIKPYGQYTQLFLKRPF